MACVWIFVLRCNKPIFRKDKLNESCYWLVSTMILARWATDECSELNLLGLFMNDIFEELHREWSNKIGLCHIKIHQSSINAIKSMLAPWNHNYDLVIGRIRGLSDIKIWRISYCLLYPQIKFSLIVVALTNVQSANFNLSMGESKDPKSNASRFDNMFRVDFFNDNNFIKK